jgi:hypothetical protein
VTKGRRKQPVAAAATPDTALDGSGVDQIEVNEVAAVTRSHSLAKDPSGAGELHPAPAKPDSPELARMLAAVDFTSEQRRVVEEALKRAKGEGKVAGQRAMFWSTDPLRLPRASIIGRVIDHLRYYETGGNKKFDLTPSQIYKVLAVALGSEKDKEHHLSDAGKKHANNEDSGEAAAHFKKDLDRRWGRLDSQGWVKKEGRKRWLTHAGQVIFRGWPAWVTKDDDREALPEPDEPRRPTP